MCHLEMDAQALTAMCLIMLTLLMTPTFAHAQSDAIIDVDWEIRDVRDIEMANFIRDDWLYGPLPQLICTYENGTNIQTRNYTVHWGELVYFTIMIPQGLFEIANSSLDRLYVAGNCWNELYVERFYIGYTAYDETWSIDTTRNDKTDPGQGFVPFSFMTLQASECSRSENESTLNITLAAVFNEEAISGIWFQFFEVFDDKENEYEAAGGAHTPVIALESDEGWKWLPLQETITPFSTSSTGFLDMDGNESTQEDQFFVRRIRNQTNEIYDINRNLIVDLLFDPTPTAFSQGDEFLSSNWMGINTWGIVFRWNDIYIWRYASNMSIVSNATMTEIRHQLWQDWENRIPLGGNYWTTEVMTLNGSTAEYSQYWPWGFREYPTTWLGFGMEQSFNLAVDNRTSLAASLKSEYAGLLLFNDSLDTGHVGVPDFSVQDGVADSEEATHIFVISNATDIDFSLPFNETATVGNRTVSTEEEVSFGFKVRDAEGTLYPLHGLAVSGLVGVWDFLGNVHPSSESELPFDYRRSGSIIDELEFDFHYTFHEANSTDNPDPNNHLVEAKVDQYIGDWDLVFPSKYTNDKFEGRSLATAYFAALSTETATQFQADDKIVQDNDFHSMVGDIYRFGVENRTIAMIQMGGQDYIWGKDGETYSCAASTVPMTAFTDMYESENGTSVTRWEFDDDYYFMLSGFRHWDGFSITNDPEYGMYTVALAGDQVLLIVAIGGISVIVIMAAIVVYQRKRRR